MDKIRLKLRAKHFLNATYCIADKCGIANAAKDLFNTKNVTVDLYHTSIDGILYTHDMYGYLDFGNDQKAAINARHPDTIIRTIELTYSPINYV